jgi:hypothetical protein
MFACALLAMDRSESVVVGEPFIVFFRVISLQQFGCFRSKTEINCGALQSAVHDYAPTINPALESRSIQVIEERQHGQ